MTRRDFLRGLFGAAFSAPLLEALAVPPPAPAKPNPVVGRWFLEMPEVGTVEVVATFSREMMVARRLDVGWERLPNGWAKAWSVD